MVGVSVRVIHDLDDLANDMQAIRARVRPDMRGVVREGIRAGNELAKGYAKTSSGDHGKYYPRTFTPSMHRGLGLFGNTISGEYGPDESIVVQGKKGAFNPGGMGPGFERGSRNSPPHNNLSRSADLIGPIFEREVDAKVGEWFW